MKPSTFLPLAAVAALVLGIAPQAKAQCSNAILAGHHFAYTSTGALVAAPIPSFLWGPYAEGGVQQFDGKGGLTFTYNASQNGNVGPATATGTYSVNSDCTGQFTESGGGVTSHFSFVVDENGLGFQAICQDAGAVITRIGHRQFF